MGKHIDYDKRWYDLLDKAAGGDRGVIDSMTPQKADEAILVAFRHFLLECYADQILDEMGRALTHDDSEQALRMKVVSLHHWKPDDVRALDTEALIYALTGELSHFKLPSDAVEVVQPLMNRRPYISGALSHHQPD